MSFGDAKEQVRQAIDIVDLVGSYLELRRQGRNYVGRCPWHDDTRPSLNVNPDRQTWKCWVCNIGGDAFSFVMQKERCDFKEALQMLAERAGIELVQSTRRIEPGSADDKTTLYACCQWAARQYQECLLKSDAAALARKYLAERAISAESVEKFTLGFVPDAWSWLMDRAKTTPYTPAVLEACGLLTRNETGRVYDRFRGRILFPIRDLQGRVISFGGRVVPGLSDSQPGKYINGSETRLFSKSDNLYALELARDTIGKSKSITVVEGYTDVILCHQYGVTDVVACLGTALNERHIKLIRRFAETVYLLLDGDEAGQRRTSEVLELFVAANVDLRIVTLPEELDPAEFLQERGGEAFQGVMKQSVDALAHKIRLATAGIDLARDTHKASQALEEILTTLARGTPAGTLDTGALKVHQLLARLAREFGLEESVIRSRFSQLRRTIKGSFRENREENEETSNYRPSDLSPRECELIELLVQHPELAPTALSEIADDDLTSQPARLIVRAYRQREEAGRALDFGAVLAEIENVSLKSLLVHLDDLASRKAEKALADPATRMRLVIARFQEFHEQRQLKEAELALAEKRFDEQEELSVLASMIAAKRRQQGIHP
ncbi:MAG TPA: DNA primase [Pirellulaceae bacterium]|nr:DNA primase [Pirellulaceae bacterium]